MLHVATFGVLQVIGSGHGIGQYAAHHFTNSLLQVTTIAWLEVLVSTLLGLMSITISTCSHNTYNTRAHCCNINQSSLLNLRP